MVFGRKKQPQQPPPPVMPPQPHQPAAPRPNPGSAARALTRESDRNVMRAQRDMQRERLRLEGEERKITAEIKSLSRQGRVAEARMLAKNLVQVRNAKQRTFQAGSQVSAIGTQARMAQTDATMMGVMSSATTVMKNASGLANPQAQMQVVQDYDMQSERYKLNQEMTDEVFDSVLGGSEVETESDDVLNSVLDEIGLEVSAKAGAPSIRPQEHVPTQQAAETTDDAALMQRIAKLGGA